MVRVHDGALAEEYALSSTTLVVVEVCLAQVQLTSALHASHARCATTESTATMRVQNYGGSRITVAVAAVVELSESFQEAL